MAQAAACGERVLESTGARLLCPRHGPAPSERRASPIQSSRPVEHAAPLHRALRGRQAWPPRTSNPELATLHRATIGRGWPLRISGFAMARASSNATAARLHWPLVEPRGPFFGGARAAAGVYTTERTENTALVFPRGAVYPHQSPSGGGARGGRMDALGPTADSQPRPHCATPAHPPLFRPGRRRFHPGGSRR